MKSILRLFLGVAALSLSLSGTAAATASDAGQDAVHHRTGAVTGTVVGPHGHAVADALVVVRIEGAPGRPPVEIRTRTDRRGHFSLPRVPAGHGRVSAHDRHVGHDRERIVVHAGHVTRVRLRLHP